MRLTYTDIKQAHFRNIGKANQFNDAVLLADFQYSLGQRYQMIFGTLSSYINQDELTADTVAGQQDYYYPPGTVGVDSATIIIGSVQYTLTPIYDQYSWDMLNALQIQPTAIPQFFFPKKDTFGIWPIPQAVYTITFQRFFRDRNMLVDDYSEGTVAVVSGDNTITGTDTVFTEAMIGRWFTVTNTATPGQGYWYRIGAVTDGTTLELETDWNSISSSGTTYRIGESPEIPEEGHVMLPAGTAADFYAGLRNDPDNATRFDNLFWTGSYVNSSRTEDDKNISGGLIGMLRKYKDRDRDVIILRNPDIISPTYKIFAESISG